MARSLQRSLTARHELALTRHQSRQELFSKTTVDWGWPEYAFPTYVKSHIHRDKLEENEMVLRTYVPTADADTHRSGSMPNGWRRSQTAIRSGCTRRMASGCGIKTGDLVRISTDIGYFCQPCLGDRGHAAVQSSRARTTSAAGDVTRTRKSNRWSTNQVTVEGRVSRANGRCGSPKASARTKAAIPTLRASSGPTAACIRTSRFPSIPIRFRECIAGTKEVTVEPAKEGDEHGDVFVDTDKSFAIYKEWLAMARPAPGPDGLRRPLWLARPLRPSEEMFYVQPPDHAAG